MPETAVIAANPRSAYQSSLFAAGLFGISLLVIFHQTTWSMISIWLRSDTFAHGFLILPIVLWLIWERREKLRLISPVPVLWVALLMIPPGFVWLLAWLVDVLVVQQLALVAMLVVGAWSILGHQLAWQLVFPLFFLFLAVPMGEALVPPMMEFTATSTVWLIQLTGVPVYREGLYFSLPSGNWSVVEACSGVRYIIASVTLGLLYAYLTYRSFWRRVLFVLTSAIMPIFANTIRAYIIVMLGHVSDMEVATGVDHLIYGWLFFGLVMLLLFWVGSFFREDREAIAVGGKGGEGSQATTPASASSLVVAILVSLIAAGIWPVLAVTTQSTLDGDTRVDVALPVPEGAWDIASEANWHWHPLQVVDGQAEAFYRKGDEVVGLYVQYTNNAQSGGEVVGSSTRFVEKDSGIRIVSLDSSGVRLSHHSNHLVDQAQLQGASGGLLAWSWYRIGDVHTSNDYLAKLYEARASLGLGSSGSYRIVLVTRRQGSLLSTQALLQDFLDVFGDELNRALDGATAGPQ